ncbi:MAG TPA: right-handed parallel beta-helix repeat-containing protein [Chloroflexota bacterium]|nr:right-handed parallel beta-helix repeat-containing protein [Chloroflexota bacterium]
MAAPAAEPQQDHIPPLAATGGTPIWQDTVGCDVTLEGCDIAGVKGANAVSVFAGSTLMLRDCRIHDSDGHGVLLCGNQATVERCDVYAHKLQGVRVESGGNLNMREGQVHACKPGITVAGKSQATVEGCTLFRNGYSDGGETYSQLWVGDDSTITVRRCTIRDGAPDGIAFRHKGGGTVEDCAIYNNDQDGVGIEEGSNPTIRRCRINRNKRKAIDVGRDCPAVVEDCDLTDNRRGAWGLPLFGVRDLCRNRNKE